ncbi:WYL domain-containing protein [Tenuifilaceae bacterium CYCD]|nr:WYL domain-containing protein [Tenuifilaceae bacterium CYCD]
MSKRAFFKRYLWLYDTIKNKPYITFNEIADKFDNSNFKDDDEAGFSKRTFHRDLSEIIELFGVEISYDNTYRGYYIESESLTQNTETLLDSYRFINTYQVFKEANCYIAAEPRKSGSEHLLILLDAIQNRKRVEFLYCKYIEETTEKRTIEPFFIKEFKGRWYVVAKDRKDKLIKSFALERIVNDPMPASSSASFDIPQGITPASYFKESFGVFKISDAKVEEVELSFKPLKGKFIKSQPLHRSQTIIIDNEVELRIKLKLQITHDFIMELLSHGSEIKVIAPDNLQNKIIRELVKTTNQYNLNHH